jgi:hypothetical protein
MGEISCKAMVTPPTQQANESLKNKKAAAVARDGW